MTVLDRLHQEAMHKPAELLLAPEEVLPVALAMYNAVAISPSAPSMAEIFEQINDGKTKFRDIPLRVSAASNP